MGKGKQRRVYVAALMLAGFLLAAGCSSSDSDDASSETTGSTLKIGTVPDDEVWIGLEAPLTGDQAGVGIDMLRGAEMAANALNGNGGIGGKQVKIVPIDDRADPKVGVVAARAAIAEGLSAVVGPYNSGVGSKTLPLYIEAGIVPLRFTSADTTQGLGFTLQPMTSQIAPVATTAITEWAGAKKVALIFDSSTEYTVEADKAMVASLRAAGVEVVADIPVEPGQKEYTAAVAAANAKGADLVYLVTYYPEAAVLAKEMLSSGTSAKCLGDYSATDDAFVEAAGPEAAKNCPLVGVPAPSDFPDSAELVAKFKVEFGEEPGTWSPYAYDSVNVLAEAAEEASGFEAKPLQAALESADGSMGWTGPVSFEVPSGNRIPAPVVVVAPGMDGMLHVDESWAMATGFKLG